MANFIGMDTGKPRRQQQPKSEPISGAGVAFVSSDKKSKGTWPVCLACIRKYEGGWEMCNQISEKVRENIEKLVATSTFNDKSSISNGDGTSTPRTSGEGRPNRQKRGTANAVVKGEDDTEETKTKEDGMLTQDHILQILCMTNTVICHVNKPEEPAAKAEGCWDRDILANLGFANIQVGGATCGIDNNNQYQRVLFTEVGWKVQWVCGTTPLKIKKKIKTTPKSSDANDLPTVKVDKKPAFVKSCMRNLNSAVALAIVSGRSAKTAVKDMYSHASLAEWFGFVRLGATFIVCALLARQYGSLIKRTWV